MSSTIGEVIHKRKEAKEKQRDKGHLPYVQMDNSTNGYDTTAVNTELSNTEEQSSTVQDNKRADLPKNKQLLQSAAIDEYLLELVMDDVIDPQFTPWVAKCCYALTVPVVNRLVISARAGREPKKLLAFKLKAAMQLHHKRVFQSL